MENLQVIDKAFDGLVENTAEERDMYQKSCFGHFQRMQRGMTFFCGIGHRLLLSELHHDGPSDEMRFMLGQRSVRFSRVEFCLIIELNFEAISDTELYEDIPNGIHHKYFSGRDVVTLLNLKQGLNREWQEQFDIMFTEAELTDTDAERGLWYYQGIDKVGNLYLEDVDSTTMMGGICHRMQNMLGELRDKGTLTGSKSPRHKQQSTGVTAPTTVFDAPTK
ncbi:hypothetical protein Dsin_032934 [Dipteronia sinensis]|uniref:Uncharacterized protein n=1 Tax=Dipteronia sinensis TaxID=43782 RepID=A0AAE0DQK2_9ROSI|nr:hypothetical protein Dsin_032934 [Dipteronia sinensis]